jgi:hypothetical protein
MSVMMAGGDPAADVALHQGLAEPDSEDLRRSVSELAVHWQFADSSHFIRAFKRATDATLFKVIYAWGRRTETSRLDVADWGRNPAAPEFGRYGMLHVRYGKAKRGQPPRRRNVASVMGGRWRRWPITWRTSGRSSAATATRRCG